MEGGPKKVPLCTNRMNSITHIGCRTLQQEVMVFELLVVQFHLIGGIIGPTTLAAS